MAKFRSKLKKKQGGKKWIRGQSSTSNPEITKHRAKAKSRFFQTNLSLAPPKSDDKNGLTLEAVTKHDAMQSFNAVEDKPVNEISNSMKSFNMDDDDFMSESQQGGTFKTFQTFASNWSACSNMSFSKLLNNFRADTYLHKEMLAILAALTEVIKEKGGKQTSTEYFLALMETIEATKEENDTIAAISLLSMGIKSVPQAVLRAKFSESGQILLELLERFSDTEKQHVLRIIIGCLSVLLRAQEYSQWKLSSTLKFFDSILAFTIHTRPKVRKAAQHAIVAIVHGSCFMLPPKDENENEGGEEKKSLIKCHPVSERVAKFCVNQFKPENIGGNQTIVLHTLGLLHNALPGFSKDDIKTVCENLLSIMTAPNVLIRTTCFQTFHSLFTAKKENLTASLTGRLITALYDYRPDKSDIKQSIAWLTVLKDGHVSLAKCNLQMCSTALPKFVEICINDFWTSENLSVVSAASNALKEILYECIQPCCETKDSNELKSYSNPINKVIQTFTKALTSLPFGHASNHILILFAIIFEICGQHFGKSLANALKIIQNRYDDQASNRLQIEHAILAAIRTMDTEIVLECIALQDEENKIDVNKTWILPLLREGLQQSTFAIFNNRILKMASQCYNTWNKLKQSENSKSEAHIYELICCQLWGLFPGFCRSPKDVSNFKYIAKTLGTVLNDNPEFRAPILDGLKELISSLNTDTDREEIAKFAKNFLPRIFNIYTSKPNGSYENEIRQSAFETVKVYLQITPKEVIDELYHTASAQLADKSCGLFAYDTVSDIIEQLILYQNEENILKSYQEFITPTLKRHQSNPNIKIEQNLRRKMKKAYKLLQNILQSNNEGCCRFMELKLGNIQKLLLNSIIHKGLEGIQLYRLNCLNLLIDKQPEITVNNKLVTKTLSEAVAAYHNDTVKSENLANHLIQKIGEMHNKESKLNEFIDLIIAGFTGDTQMITNTIWVLKNVLQEFNGSFNVDTLKYILEQVLVFTIGNNRQEVDAGVNFILTYTKILPSAFVSNYLPLIMKTLSIMVPDAKRHCRLLIGFLLKKLCKRFGAVEIIKLVPGNDEITHKRLRKIKKDLARSKRNKAEDLKKQKQSNGDDDDNDDHFDVSLEKKSLTIDDILEESGSELGSDDEESGKRTEKKSKKKMETYIKESPDNIVDLADLDAINKITTTEPIDQDGKSNQSNKKQKDANRGFKTDSSGRLIIEDIEDYSDSDEDPDENVGYKDKSKKRAYDEDETDSDDDEQSDSGPSSRKKQAVESMSMKSGRTAGSGISFGSSKYVAGGKGIHRPLAASVKSGYSSKSTKTAKSMQSTGSEYRSKKGQGDILKKGKHEPYAYVPLSRNSLNRRKRAKNAGQFKNIVKGARKGAAAGSKNRLIKKATGKKR
uniref:Uncharacterized protein n=1 Tax=Corethrella appendiculata TaxID=1370023 RepID=W4VRP4_9DIPT